ncbi:Transmembrane protein 43 (Partial), partial [Seminavis robusta]|eukprot:Sro2484_g328950.1 Transmembrane protein 43 (337) ;mRNA; r:2-1013
MSDSVVRITHQSYGSRIAGSCKALCFVPIFLIAGILVLSWNEGNLVTQRKALDEGLKSVVDIPSTESVNAENEGSLIHFVGTAKPDSQVTDPIFGVAPPNALLLKRTVEMYQWTESSHSETRKNTGGSTDTVTTYSYSKEWRDRAVDSGSFEESSGHQNPSGGMLFPSDTVAANPIHVGAFELSSAVVQKMHWYQPLQSGISVDTIQDNSTRNQATVFGSRFYFGDGSSGSPQIGDTRVSFEQVPSQTISVVAKQIGESLSSYTAKSGGSVLLVEAGPHDAAEMFKHANEALTIQTWLIRLGGFLLIYFAFEIAMKPLSVFADVLPFLGDLVEAGTS